MSSPYYYTQGKFWGGATASKMIFMILAIFPITGMLGLDHLYLHSPGTFILKAILNVVTLGFWYMHDVMQAISFEGGDIGAKGLSVPWFGPAGIGAGAFKGEGGGEGGGAEAPQNALMYMAYVLSAMFIPFGLDYVIAGDYVGAVAKYMSIFMFGIGLLYGVFNVYKIVMKPEVVFCEGTYRYPPFSWLIGGANADVNFTTKVGCPSRPAEQSVSILEFVRGVAKGLDRIPVVGPKVSAPIYAALATADAAIATAEGAVATAKGVVDTAAQGVQMATGVATQAMGAAKMISGAITPGGIEAQVKAAVAADATNAEGALATAKGVTMAATQAMGAANTISGAANALLPMPTQKGGGGSSGGQGEKSILMIGTFAFLFVSSAVITLQKTFRRVKEAFADAPPLVALGGHLGNKKKEKEENVVELPPRASEPGLF